MTVQLNHIIVWCHDKQRSADFLAEMFGRSAPATFMHFLVVDMDNGVSIDFMEKEGPVAQQHYAFLVSDPEFDAIYGRIKARGLDHWADPARKQPGEINHHFGGRGVYFPDPDGHFLEAITRPYARDQIPADRSFASIDQAASSSSSPRKRQSMDGGVSRQYAA